MAELLEDIKKDVTSHPGGFVAVVIDVEVFPWAEGLGEASRALSTSNQLYVHIVTFHISDKIQCASKFFHFPPLRRRRISDRVGS